MTDPLLYLIAGEGLGSIIGTALVVYLYIFSSPLRDVTASANYNARAWTRGEWSIRTGRLKRIPEVKTREDPSVELE